MTPWSHHHTVKGMLFSKIEYVLLRLLRRHFFSNDFLERFGAFIPYYLKNCNQSDPRHVVDKYEPCAKKNGFPLNGKIVLEIGPGVTNSTAYELSARGCAQVYAYEPYAKFNLEADKRQFIGICQRYNTPQNEICSKVKRVQKLEGVEDGTIDLVFSHSVLEHVNDPEWLLKILYRKLNSHGIMIHQVDYRDHFFKYPYHILLFSKNIWRRWLNPGDLPGWRLKDHLSMFDETGYDISVDNIREDPVNFEKIRNFISEDYDQKDSSLAVSHCTIVVRKRLYNA